MTILANTDYVIGEGSLLVEVFVKELYTAKSTLSNDWQGA